MEFETPRSCGAAQAEKTYLEDSMNKDIREYQDDEINLYELLSTFWDHKLLILAITAVFGIIGVIYALWAPQIWSAKAIVVAPSSLELETLQHRLDGLVAASQINDTEVIISKNYSDFIGLFTEEKLFSDFIQSFNSYDNKYAFLTKNGLIQEQDVNDERAYQRYLEKMTGGIIANQRSSENFFTLSFASENAREAHDRLRQYIDFIQENEMATKNKVLTEKIEGKIQLLSRDVRLLQAETLQRLQEEIARTEFALRISKSAGLEDPVENLNNQTLFTIDLGARALNEKLAILKEIKKPELINLDLSELRLRLDSLQAIQQEDVRFTSFRFLQSPSPQMSPDKPKRLLVIILATLAGLVVGMLLSLCLDRRAS